MFEEGRAAPARRGLRRARGKSVSTLSESESLLLDYSLAVLAGFLIINYRI